MSVSSQNLRSQFSAQEWRSLGVLFAVAARVAVADGLYDDDESTLEGRLLHGLWPFPLEPEIHHRLNSRAELAREVLTLEGGDVLADLASGGDLRRGLSAPEHLEAWVARSTDAEDESLRRALARGLLFEAINVAARIADADGDVTSIEVGWLREMVTNLGVALEEAHFVCVAAAPGSESAFVSLLPAAADGETDLRKLAGTCSIADVRYEYTATPESFRYQPEAGGAAIEVPASRVAVVRVMPMAGSGPFVMFGEGLDAEHVFLSMTFWGDDATEKAVNVGFMLGARVFRME